MRLAPRVTHISRRGRAEAAVAEGGGRTFNIHFFNLYIERAEERLKRKMKDGGGGQGGCRRGAQAGGERVAGDK